MITSHDGMLRSRLPQTVRRLMRLRLDRYGGGGDCGLGSHELVSGSAQSSDSSQQTPPQTVPGSPASQRTCTVRPEGARWRVQLQMMPEALAAAVLIATLGLEQQMVRSTARVILIPREPSVVG